MLADDGRGLIAALIGRWRQSIFAPVAAAPWQVTMNAPDHVIDALALLKGEYDRDGDIAVHRSAMIETNAVVKGPAIIGPGCFIAHGAYLRGGVFLDEKCIIGPNAELKSSFMFKGSKLAHLNFVGDSILGSDVNIEAGAVIANYRNELKSRAIRIRKGSMIYETGVDKFGAILGDHARIGANAVIAPGAICDRGVSVTRTALLDQYPHD